MTETTTIEKTISKPKAAEFADAFTKRRPYAHISNGRMEGGKFRFDIERSEVESEDVFEEDMVLLSFHITYMPHIDSILKEFGLYADKEFFITEAKDVIAVSENHQNEQGGGKMSFQSWFHNIPESILAVNDRAEIVLAIHPEREDKTGLGRKYTIAGYIHANNFDFQPYGDDRIEKGYYYNILRVSEKIVNGDKIYRRKKIFSLMFSILHHLVYKNGVNFCFACMGKENQSIKEALHRSSVFHGEHYERLPFTVYSKVNRFYGSKSEFAHCVDITDDEAKLREYYKLMHEKHKKFLFYHLLTVDIFLDFVRKLTAYSKSSRVYAILNADGSIKAACLAMNWGDWLKFEIKNPKGIFKIVQASGVMEKFFRPMLGVGDPKTFSKMLKGLCFHYRDAHGVGVTFLSTYDGDPYKQIYKSILDDQYAYFIICNDKEKLQQFKQRSATAEGHPRLFLDQPII
jgi:hypothetical protein